MSDRYVLAFVGENANGILRWWTEKILQSLEKHGFSHSLIDLREANWAEKLNYRLGKGKPQFCFSFQGMGMNLRLPNGDNIWTANAIPFFSYLGDNPYHAPHLHTATGPGMYLLYGTADFLQTYTTFLNGRAHAGVMPCGYSENIFSDRTEWAKRKHAVIYVKTGVDAEALRRQWDHFPQKIRAILHDTAAEVLSGRDETVMTLCAGSFAHQQIHWGDRNEFFLSACSLVDRYARAVRAERMVHALMPHDALIVGDWSHLDRSGSKARFVPPVKAEDLDELYADSKIVVNTLPTVRFGMHERIIAGLFAKAAVVSDSTPFLQKRFQNCPSFLGVDIDKETFSEQLSATLTSCLADSSMAEKTQVSAAVAHDLFGLESFVQHLLDYAELERFRQAISFWNFQPLPDRFSQSVAA